MTCPNCGHDNPAEARFCGNCGSALASAAGEPPEEGAGVKGRDPRRRFARSRTNKMLLGVAGGLGEYLGIAPALIRIAFIPLTLLGLFFYPLFLTGVLGYIILAFVMRSPEPVAEVGGQAACPKCGHYNPGDARFCGNCGSALAADTAVPQQTEIGKESMRDAVAKNDEGVRLFQARDLEGAIAAFTEAITLNRGFTAAYRNRAAAYQSLGRHQEAQADLDVNPELVAERRQAAERESTYKSAFLWTAIPIVALSIISTAGGVSGSYDSFFFLYFLWFIAAFAVVVALGFAIDLRGRTAAGILAGVGVGVLALAATCFANISTVDLQF